ncbi:uncharacterized protein LOC108217653 isoform X1 [Daucus carota subsp. sativus]|uniref:uncharacterized protein LOC108217653 isoform X1 n=1 Tax=Daucus carota subsp. sativus TaxID=79200 RepID=UPI00308351CA
MLSSGQSTWPHILVLLILYKFTISASKSVSYTKHCASVVPEATPTTYDTNVTFSELDTLNSFVPEGRRIFRQNSSVTSLNFRSVGRIYETDLKGVYKIDAELRIRVYNYIDDTYDFVSTSTQGRSSRRPRRFERLIFLIHGFWSESSGKGCLVGSAPWYSSKVYSVPEVTWYEYKLISEETVKEYYVFHNAESSVPGSKLGKICSFFNKMHLSDFSLEYARSCNSSLRKCSLLDGVDKYSPGYVSLYIIQCNEYRKMMRILVRLPTPGYDERYDMLDPNTTLVGEGLWDEKTNSLVIVACRTSSSSSSGDAHLGDCSFRLSLYYPSVWSIKTRDKVVGRIWTNKTAQDVGYFDPINFRNSVGFIKVPGFKYEYTEIEKVNKLCPTKALTRGERYPSGEFYDMRFDMSLQDSEYIGGGSAKPIFIGNKSYLDYSVFRTNSRQGGNGENVKSEVEFENVVSDNVQLNVSYKLGISLMSGVKSGSGRHSILHTSFRPHGYIIISAEGVYDSGTGSLCMTGCRNLAFRNFQDCDIVLHFHFPGSTRAKGGFMKGSIQSTRNQSDPHFFEQLNMTSSASTSSEERQSLWRIDLEITMVLICNMNACILVCFQLYHMKRYPSTVPHMSLVMLVILALGHLIPLVLNFEALSMAPQNTQTIKLGRFEWLEVNEVIVRVATMVAFIMQFRLLQLAWTARHAGQSTDPDISVAEIKTLLVLLPIYIVGGMDAYLLKWEKFNYSKSSRALNYSRVQYQQYTLWGYLRSYATLILDGFLFPQVILNLFQMSRQSALSMPFILGTTLVHSVPHAYHLYVNNYVYANPSADFYSAAWDTIIPLASFLLVAVIYLQQRYGGLVILPTKFRDLELYAKVPEA